MSKKVFLVGKVHEVGPATIMSVQQEIQNDLDRLTGEHKVELAANMVSEDEIEPDIDSDEEEEFEREEDFIYVDPSSSSSSDEQFTDADL